MKRNDIFDDKEIIVNFVSETVEMLDEVEPKIVELQERVLNEGVFDAELINSVFRLFHTLKGSAGFLELGNLEAVTHEAENLLDLYRKGKMQITPDQMELIFKTCDFIRKTMSNIEKFASDQGFELEVDEILQDYSTLRDSESERSKPKENPNLMQPSKTDDTLPGHSAKVIDSFIEEVNNILNAIDFELSKLEINSTDSTAIENIIEYTTLFKEKSQELGYDDMVMVLQKFQNYFVNCKDGQIINYKENVSFLIKIVEVINGGLIKIKQGNIDYMVSSMGLIAFLDDMIIESKTKQEPAPKKETTKKTGKEPNQQILKVLPAEKSKPSKSEVDVKPTEPEIAPIPAEPEVISEPEEIVAEFTAPEEEEDEAISIQEYEDSAELKQSNTAKTDLLSLKNKKYNTDEVEKITRSSIKVDVDKVDKLVNWVGELAIAESMVVQNPLLKDLDDSGFENAVYNLHRIISEIQYTAMSLRMVPVESTFKKMLRLVNELSRKTGKKIHLTIKGEDTELDKSVVEALNDPLVHILRNSIDHGIETPEERIKLGKSETGNITLMATQEGAEIHIKIEDDGRGMNKEKILKKAIDNGLIKDSVGLKDSEIYNFIFEPGFSTADKITEVSGRGVGMDVVKRNMEKVKGNIEINTQAGIGTVITLRIPLTMAIMDGMLVQIGDNFYTIPLMSIKEFFQPTSDMVTMTPDRQEIVCVRNELIPVIRLHNIYNITPLSTKLEEGILIIVESRGANFCFLVDNIVGQQQAVIKALPEYLSNVNGISGCTILGNGEISPIVDINGIVNKIKETEEY